MCSTGLFALFIIKQTSPMLSLTDSENTAQNECIELLRSTKILHL